MSHAEHEWSRDHLAAHAADGLPAGERARIEAHLSECTICRAELDEIRSLDASLGKLFTPVRSRVGMEDRVIRALRTAPQKRTRGSGWRIVTSAAAIFLVGLVGFVVTEIDRASRRPAPVEPVAVSPPRKPRGEAYAPSDLRIDGVYGNSRNRSYAGPSPIFSADDLAKDMARKSILLMEKSVEDPVYRRNAQESDHNETADEEEFSKSKGDSLNFVSDKPFKGKGTYDVIGGGGGGGGRFGSRLGGKRDMIAAANAKDNYYRYENNAKADPAARAAKYFKPGEAVAVAAVDDLEKDLGELATKAVAVERVVQAEPEKPSPPAEKKPQDIPDAPKRKIIRSGSIEFEIEAFDSTVARITQIAGEEGGFVATVNSQKLPNGKVRGTIVVRVPPDRLDTLILKLRALGELKSQQIGSQDVTKRYYDIESRLRAARTMEERLLKMIKDGKGAIKDLLLAEKELGEWRTKIESLEGEIRYYNNLISLSTLTITLYEKEIRSPFAIKETERVEMGLEVEDVETSHRDALTQVADAKGRVTKSELKQLAAGQFHALLEFEVAPEAAGPLRDRLKQLGTVARLDVNRTQKTEGGTGRPGAVQVTRADTQFSVSIYNLANIAPRETTIIRIAAADPEEAFKTILDRVEQAGGRVVSSNLNRQKNEQTTGSIRFEVKSTEADAVLLDVRATGEVMHLQVTENPDAQNVTRSKRGFSCELFALGRVEPLVTTTTVLAAGDVPTAYAAIAEAVRKATGRILVSQLDEGNASHVTGNLHFEVSREKEQEVLAAVGAAGQVASRTVRRATNPQNAIDSKVRLNLTIVEMASLMPAVTTTLRLGVKAVPEAHAALVEAVARANGWVLTSQISEVDHHNVTATLYFDVAKDKDGDIAAALAAAGDVLSRNASRAQGSSRSPIEKSRYQLTLISLEQIPPRENFTLAVEVSDVSKAVESVTSVAGDAKGKVETRISKERSGRDVASVTVTVPLAEGAALAEKIKRLGTVRVVESWKNPKVPESRLAVAQLNVTISNDLIVPSDSGPWTRIKEGFSLSLQAGSWALMLLMIGLFFVLPLALTFWGGYRLYRKVAPRKVSE